MSLSETTKTIQKLVGVTADGNFGPVTANAVLKEFIRVGIANPSTVSVHHVKASSFADPADVAAFKRCKAQGNSDQVCFRVGDNGIGFTGIICSTEDECLCALPPDDWREKWGSKANAAGKKVAVTYKGKRVIGRLGDTMPAKDRIGNGAGIDLNPGFAKAFGISPPFMISGVTWEWAE